MIKDADFDSHCASFCEALCLFFFFFLFFSFFHPVRLNLRGGHQTGFGIQVQLEGGGAAGGVNKRGEQLRKSIHVKGRG